MAVMHASFAPEYGEAWSALQVAGTLGMTNSFARQAIAAGEAVGFTLCRAAGPEVELLLIAVMPAHRGLGVGRMLIDRAAQDAFVRGASEMFLEVRENNHSARRLYSRSGFLDIGRRPDYYAGNNGHRHAAITMRRQLFDLTR